MNIKRSIKIALARIDKSQTWLAEESGVARTTISIMCSTNRTSTASVAELAKALSMSVSEFIAIGEE